MNDRQPYASIDDPSGKLHVDFYETERLTLGALKETLRDFRARFDPSEVPRVIHILGGDAFYYRVLNTLRAKVAITLRPNPDPKGTRLIPDTWYGLQIKRHKDHGEKDALFVEMADGSLIFLDLKGGSNETRHHG